MAFHVDPTSHGQFAAAMSGSLPSAEEVAPQVWAIASPIPEGQLRYTLTYLLLDSDGGIHLIDPGWDSEQNFAILASSIHALGFSLAQLKSTIVTHFHPDHLGIADRLRRELGAELLMSGVEERVLEHEVESAIRDRGEYAETLGRWGVPDDRRPELVSSFDRPVLTGRVGADRWIDDQDVLELPGHALRVIATPGHTGGHLCLADADRGVLYSGDHVLPKIFSGIGIGSLPGTAPMIDFLESLSKLEPYDDFEVLPGHEYRFRGLRHRRREIAEHHLRRTSEVHDLSDRLGDVPVWRYAELMAWTGGWEALRSFHLHSALRQTEMHRDLVRSGLAQEYLGGLSSNH